MSHVKSKSSIDRYSALIQWLEPAMYTDCVEPYIYRKMISFATKAAWENQVHLGNLAPSCIHD